MDLAQAQDVAGQAKDVASQAVSLISPRALAWLVGIGAAASTFVASLMADEQEQRLRNGVFGTVAGGAAGGLMALITKQDALLVIGLLGSAMGGLLGWLVSLALSWWAATSPTGRTVLEYQVGGWKGVRDRLNIEETQPLLSALGKWGQNFVRMVTRQKEEILAMPGSPQTNAYTKLVLENWLISFVDILGLLFGLARKPEYQSRVTVIVFGARDGKPTGLHWISDAGRLESHKHQREFDDKSVGYQVLSGSLSSPYFTTSDSAKAKGQDRGEQSYRPFLTFRIDDTAILAIDWPADLKHDDPFVKITQNLFHLDLVPAVRPLLQHWTGGLESAVGLQPLSTITSNPPAPPALARPSA